MASILDAVDPLSLSWAAGCAALSGAFYCVLPRSAPSGKPLGFATRFEWCVRCVEGLQGAYIAAAAARHLATAGGPLAAPVVRTMAGYLLFDTAYELVAPLVAGGAWDAGFLAHHLVGLAAHGLATRHALLRTATPYVYLAEASTPFLHASWMLDKLERAGSPLFLANGVAGALCYVAFRVALPPLTLWRFRDAAPWLAEPGGAGVHAAFQWSMVVFIGLNLFWFRKLVRMVSSKLKKT